MIGGGAGIVAMSALDIIVFAKQQVPYVATASNGVVLGVAGRF
jgi:hypothetical protein